MEGDKLSRARFDMIVLALIAVAAAGVTAYRFWPIGCADRAIVDRAAERVRHDLGAERVTFHLVNQISRTTDEMACVATARLEFKDRENTHRDVAYRATFDQAGRVLDVAATPNPAEP